MNDYFDQLESGLRDAVRRRAHMPWYARVRGMSARRQGLMALVVALVVATPTVGAVGAVSGWFSQGKPDVYYPASPTSGVGKTVAGTRMLPIQVADPDGGPPWGMRLVRTNRGDTCIQIGRVEYGQIGTLGIDHAWANDHEFHPISPNDGAADVCGATDTAGHGFVNENSHGVAASAVVGNDYATGTAADYCRDPNQQIGPTVHPGARMSPATRRAITALRSRLKKIQAHVPLCPQSSERMIFAGLLGPDAKSVTYRTPDGKTRTQATVGGVGAYLIVFRETAHNCLDFTGTLMGGLSGCESASTGMGGGALRAPSAVTRVTYTDGRSCSDQPTASFAAAYRAFEHRLRTRYRNAPSKQVRRLFQQFLAAHHLTRRSWLQAAMPQCQPVGWIGATQPRLTGAQLESQIRVTTAEGTRFCASGPVDRAYRGQVIVCEGKIPPGFRRYYEFPPNEPQRAQVLVKVSFVARQPVTSSNSWYEWITQYPHNGGGEGSRTDQNIRSGQRIRFWEFVDADRPGTYRGTVSFVQNAGTQGVQGGGAAARDGSILVGRFSFKVP